MDKPIPKSELDAQDLRLKTVFAQRRNADKDHSSYYDGEYLITRHTESVLYGISLKEGITVYGLGGSFGSSGSNLPLIGDHPYDVLSISSYPLAILQCQLDVVKRECDDILAGRAKKLWVDSVYHRAIAQVQTLKGLIDEQSQKTEAQTSASTYTLDDVIKRLDMLGIDRWGRALWRAEVSRNGMTCSL